jgi:hypothetical protein
MELINSFRQTNVLQSGFAPGWYLPIKIVLKNQPIKNVERLRVISTSGAS